MIAPSFNHSVNSSFNHHVFCWPHFYTKTSCLSYSSLKWPSSMLLEHTVHCFVFSSPKKRGQNKNWYMYFLCEERRKKKSDTRKKQSIDKCALLRVPRKLHSFGNFKKPAECFPEMPIRMTKASFHYSLPAFLHFVRVAPGVTKSPKICSNRGFHCVGEVPKAKCRKMGDRSLKWVPAMAMWVWAYMETYTVTKAKFRSGV